MSAASTGGAPGATGAADPSGAALVRVRGLSVHFPARRAGIFPRGSDTLRAVDAVDFEIRRGETLGLVGESGCGKSTTGRAVLQLLRPTAGSVEVDGVELTGLWTRRLGGWGWRPELREMRKHMQMIFQDPYASLDPRMTVEDIVGEPLVTFGLARGEHLRREVQALLTRVGMDPRYVRRYPHEFSGGQRQRIGIARALALKPRLVVCDEPVSALDVSIQSQILNLLVDLQREMGLTYLFIAHDLAVVRHLSSRIAVMYLGSIVEVGDGVAVCDRPAHPYTKALLSAVPVPDPVKERARRRVPLVGDVPSPLRPPAGCAFHPRCPEAVERCRNERPVLRALPDGRQAACHVV
jgi:oligopeptide transport system ATP-binding protein